MNMNDLTPIEQETLQAVEAFKREMRENVIPEIVESQLLRQKLADESRQQIIRVSA